MDPKQRGDGEEGKKNSREENIGREQQRRGGKSNTEYTEGRVVAVRT